MQLKNENRWLKELVTRRQDSFEGGGAKNEGVDEEEGERIAGGVKKGVGTVVVTGAREE